MICGRCSCRRRASFDHQRTLDADGSGDTPSRRRIFVCCPRRFLKRTNCPAPGVSCRRCPGGHFAVLCSIRSRQVNGFYRQGRRDDWRPASNARWPILVAPAFVLRIEEELANVPDGGVYRASDLALASRLSFSFRAAFPTKNFSMPPAMAAQKSVVLEQQVRRVLADSKSHALIQNFAAQWMNLRKLAIVSPIRPRPLANRVEAEGFTENLRQSFRRETELLFETILREDRSIIDLLDAPYTFVDERLARHYGIPDVKGSYFRRVTLDANSPRRGLLGHGSILTLTSAPNRTSPVVRGQWILENLLARPRQIRLLASKPIWTRTLKR